MSNKPYRVPTAGTGGNVGRVIDRSQMIDFQWNGRKYAGYAGDTLASALFANGIRVVGRSFKYHRPRGVLGFGSKQGVAATRATVQPRFFVVVIKARERRFRAFGPTDPKLLRV